MFRSIMGNITGVAKTWVWDPIQQHYIQPGLQQLGKHLIEGAVSAIRPKQERLITNSSTTPSLILNETITILKLWTQGHTILYEDLEKSISNIQIILDNQELFTLNEDETESLGFLQNLLRDQLNQTASTSNSLILYPSPTRNERAPPSPAIPCSEETRQNITVNFLPGLDLILNRYQRDTAHQQRSSELTSTASGVLFGKKDPNIGRASETMNEILPLLSQENVTPRILQKSVQELIEALTLLEKSLKGEENPYQLALPYKRSMSQMLSLLREFVTIYQLQLQEKDINLDDFPNIRNQITPGQAFHIPEISQMRGFLINAIGRVQNSVISPIQQTLSQDGLVHQFTREGLGAVSSALDSTPLGSLAKQVFTYAAPKEASKTTSSSNGMFDSFFHQEEQNEKGAPPSWSAALFPFFQPFLQAFSGEGAGLWGGLSAIAARPAIGILNSMIHHMEESGEEATQAIHAVQEAKRIIEGALEARDQSFAAYQRAFSQAWDLCTKFPILIGGFEVPVGLETENHGPNPVEQLQRMASEFRQNHSYLDQSTVTKEQTNARIERLAQTGTCFGTYRLCTLALGSPKDFPSFHEIILQTKAMSEEERKNFFLIKMKEAIDADTSSNIIVRWFTSVFLPVIYWFSTLFSQNLSEGLKHYFREVVIPNIKKDDDKRLHSGSIALLGTCIDDLNKMMTDFIQNPRGSSWEHRDHIRRIKDDKIYNGARSADELYDEFADICVDEIMPKLSWTNQVGQIGTSLVKWAENSDSYAMKVIKYIAVFPLQIFVWISEYLIVAPIQWIMQGIATWGAKKAFVETKAIRNIMENIKTTRFRDTPYVPVLDFLARRLMDIHEAQIRNNAPDRGAYQSDPDNRQTIKAFLDRAFRFVEMWNTNSRQEMQSIIDGPSGFSGEMRKMVEGALIPPIQNALVDLIEVVQSLATEEDQLERFLFELCEIADGALSTEGKELTPRERRERSREFEDTRKLIECTLNAILWTVCIEATSEMGKSGTVQAAKDHINWLKEIFLGRKVATPLRHESDADISAHRGALDLDEEEISLPSTADNAVDLEELEIRTGAITDWKEALTEFSINPGENGRLLDRAYQVCFQIMKDLETKEIELNIEQKTGAITRQHLERRSSVIFEAVKDVYDQFHRLHRFYLYDSYQDKDIDPANKTVECLQKLDNLSTNLYRLQNGIKNKLDVRLIAENLSSSIEEIASEERRLSSQELPLILNSLKAEIEQLRRYIDSNLLKNLMAQNHYSKIVEIILQDILARAIEDWDNRHTIFSEMDKIVEQFSKDEKDTIITLKREIEFQPTKEGASDLLKRKSALFMKPLRDTELQIDEEFKYIREKLQILLQKKYELESEIDEARAIFRHEVLSPSSHKSNPLQHEIGQILNSLTQLERTIQETSHVEFLQIEFPAPLKAMGHLGISLLQQTLFKEMSSRAITFIDALCNPDVFEMFIRNMAIRPLVESLRGEKKPLYSDD